MSFEDALVGVIHWNSSSTIIKSHLLPLRFVPDRTICSASSMSACVLSRAGGERIRRFPAWPSAARCSGVSRTATGRGAFAGVGATCVGAGVGVVALGTLEGLEESAPCGRGVLSSTRLVTVPTTEPAVMQSATLPQTDIRSEPYSDVDLAMRR